MVNGAEVLVAGSPGDRLLDLLRNQLGLTGTKEACGVGECGSCTVLIDGVPVLACITLTGLVRGEVETIEGLREETLNLRADLASVGGLQCGFCTPGQVVSAGPVIRRRQPVNDAEIRHAISGNICRCTGYNGIVAAIQLAMDRYS